MLEAFGAWLTKRGDETCFVNAVQKYATDSARRDELYGYFGQPCVTDGVESFIMYD